MGNIASFSMSVAGVCGLFIASMGLDKSEQDLDLASGVAKNCGAYSENVALAKGMNWVAANFNFYLDSNGQSKSAFYNTYGIERLGRLSGQRFIDKYDWYREGCEKLVRMQESRRVDRRPRRNRRLPHPGHSFALLFLSKGRTPVLISKFAWGDFQNRGNGTFVEVPTGPQGQVNWNRKHNDTRHIVEYCSQELFKGAPLSWQVYDVRRRDFGNDQVAGGKSGKEKILEEVGLLLQSPLLYINGHGPIGGREGLTGAQKEIIKTYVEEGGFLLVEACCGDKEFTDSFKELMKELFPDNKFRRMPPEHAIWQMYPGITPLDFPEVEVFERGCRTVCVFSPIPLAGYWEEAKYMPKDGKNPANRGEKAYCLARNIVAYATGGELPKPKLTKQAIVAKGGPEVGVTRSYFKAAQLKLQGDPEPAPDALKNLMGYLRDNARLEVSLNSVVVFPHDEQLTTFKFNYLHGRKPLQFGEAEIENLQSNLNTGGLLFADAACGGYEQWKAFDKSFREMCAKLYPDRKLVVIQETEGGKEDPLFKIAREAGINIKTVKCRRELPNDKGPEPGEPKTYPVLLEGIKIDGRWVVIYSKYDIGCAIEGHKAADCLGHERIARSASPRQLCVFVEALNRQKPGTAVSACSRSFVRFHGQLDLLTVAASPQATERPGLTMLAAKCRLPYPSSDRRASTAGRRASAAPAAHYRDDRLYGDASDFVLLVLTTVNPTRQPARRSQFGLPLGPSVFHQPLHTSPGTNPFGVNVSSSSGSPRSSCTWRTGTRRFRRSGRALSRSP